MKYQPIIPIPLLIILLAIAVIIMLFVWIRSREGRIKSTLGFFRRLAIAILAFIIALRPMREEHGAEVQLSNLDILFVLDTTLSMWAQDGPNGTRFKTAQNDIKEIMNELSGANFGLITFQNKAVVLAPFTQDQETVLSVLNSIPPPDKYYLQGSRLDTPYYDLENLLISSDRKENRQTIVFFLTDGEVTNPSNTPFDYQVLSELVDGGAVIGYGTKEGGLIKDDYGVVYNPVTYEQAISYIDEASLQNMADSLGIKYIHRQRNTILSPIITEVKASSATITERRNDYVIFRDTYYNYVPFLLFLLALELVIRIRENAKTKDKSAKKTAKTNYKVQEVKR